MRAAQFVLALEGRKGIAMDHSDTPLKGVHVLIIENEPLIALDLADMLASAGCIPHSVPRLECALKLLDEEPIEIAILDLFEVAVKEDPRRAELPAKLHAKDIPYLFMVGGHRDLLEASYCENAPRILKPAPKAELIEAVKKALGR